MKWMGMNEYEFVQYEMVEGSDLGINEVDHEFDGILGIAAFVDRDVCKFLNTLVETDLLRCFSTNIEQPEKFGEFCSLLRMRFVCYHPGDFDIK